MDLAELRELIRQGKGQTFDWYPRDVSAPALATSLVAMANAAGGTVLIGLTSRAGRPQGLSDVEATIDTALAAALSTDPPLIIPFPRVSEMDGRDIVIVTVPPGLPHVYSLEGKYLRREGAENRTLSTRALRRLMMARGELSWEAQTPAGATSDDLDWDACAEYAERLETQSAISPEEILERRGCVVGQGEEAVPTYAGLLLFGRDPQRWARGSGIDIARFSGREMSDAFVRQSISGTLPQQLRQAEAFLMDNMRMVVRLGTGMMREEQPQFPLEAAREALVNSVAHRDYSITGDQIRVFMFADRLEVTSPGHLPGPVTVDNIMDERFSRNEVIVQVLADMGFIERLGYGIDRMMRLMQEQQLPPPRFEETGGGFRVTLLAGDESLPRAEVAPTIEQYAELELNPRQEKSLAYLLAHRRITNRDYQMLCPEVHPILRRCDVIWWIWFDRTFCSRSATSARRITSSKTQNRLHMSEGTARSNRLRRNDGSLSAIGRAKKLLDGPSIEAPLGLYFDGASAISNAWCSDRAWITSNPSGNSSAPWRILRGTTQRRKPNLAASLNRLGSCPTARNSPDSPTSPTKTRSAATGLSRTLLAMATATAKSDAGSSIRSPPITLANTSWSPKRIPARLLNTATNNNSRLKSTPLAVRRG